MEIGNIPSGASNRETQRVWRGSGGAGVAGWRAQVEREIRARVIGNCDVLTMIWLLYICALMYVPMFAHVCGCLRVCEYLGAQEDNEGYTRSPQG
jgi:hypothetical protein